MLIFVIKKYKDITKTAKFLLSLIIGGGTSNLIDRIVRGYVVDYIDINQIFSYPIFNIADISIVLGSILLIAFVIIKTMKQENEKK